MKHLLIIAIIFLTGCSIFTGHKCFYEKEIFVHRDSIEYFKFENGVGYWGRFIDKHTTEQCLICGKTYERYRRDTLRMIYHRDGEGKFRDYFTDRVIE